MRFVHRTVKVGVGHRLANEARLALQVDRQKFQQFGEPRGPKEASDVRQQNVVERRYRRRCGGGIATARTR